MPPSGSHSILRVLRGEESPSCGADKGSRARLAVIRQSPRCPRGRTMTSIPLTASQAWGTIQ